MPGKTMKAMGTGIFIAKEAFRKCALAKGAGAHHCAKLMNFHQFAPCGFFQFTPDGGYEFLWER